MSNNNSITEKENHLVFGKSNYKLLLAGIALIIAGFFIMTMDKEEYGFGVLGLWVGPIVVMLGFVVEFFAIFAKKKAE
jgi:Na+/proline symporter